MAVWFDIVVDCLDGTIRDDKSGSCGFAIVDIKTKVSSYNSLGVG
jgi:hypothetical protein